MFKILYFIKFISHKFLILFSLLYYLFTLIKRKKYFIVKNY